MTDRTEEAQLTIGQFGRLAQLSRKALRLYDDKGLLTPTRIDPDSGYRYARASGDSPPHPAAATDGDAAGGHRHGAGLQHR